jgi:acetolactate synthase-1/2/3 large subunit
MILIRGAALKEKGLRAAGRIAATTGARIACDTFAPRCQRGAGRVAVERIPYFAEQIVEFMKGAQQLILVTLIFANRSYAILNIELARVGAGNPGPKAFSMLDLHNPEFDWVKLACGMGVEASRSTSVEEFARQFASAMKNRGPRLIELVL